MKVLLVVLACSALAACGGGGGGGSSVPPPAPAPAPSGDSGTDDAEEEAENEDDSGEGSDSEGSDGAEGSDGTEGSDNSDDAEGSEEETAGETPQADPDEGEVSEGEESEFLANVFEPSDNFRYSCEVPRTGSEFQDVQGSTLDENNWLRSWSNELYLWYDEIEDRNPADFSTPDYFNLMKTFALTPSGAPRDKFHFTIDTETYQLQSRSGVTGGYGARILLLSPTVPREAVVAFTEPDSPATAPEVNLQRGARILEIDGVDLVNDSTQAGVNALNAGLFPADGSTHTFLVQDVGASEPREITMTATQVTTAPVQNVKTIETDTGTVGYLTFNRFIGTAEQQLIDAVEQLSASQITDLVLDMRYNGGGFLAIANELGYMVAGPSAASGRVFEELQFNDKHTLFDPVTGAALTPDFFRTTAAGFSAPGGTALPSLNLSRVYVLTSGSACSASESVINSLRGIDVEVIQIGTTTCGKPYGFYPFDNCGTTYFSIQFRGVNNKNFGDYSDGFSPENVPSPEGVPLPGCFVSDDFEHQLGDPDEGRLRAALTYRETGACPTTISSSSLHRARQVVQPEGELLVPEWFPARITN